MKTNIKALELIEKGLSSKTVGKLTESQIDVLHSKLIGEQVTEVPSGKKYEIGPKGGSLPSTPKGYAVKTDPITKKTVAVAAENELGEDDDIDITKDPDATDDGMGIFETEKEGKSNPWAICHSQVGPKKTRKFERCVKSVKKQLGEGKNVVSLFLENEIMKIVERNLPPRITKGDLMKYLTESDTEVAPTRTKPTTKPGTRPSHPGKNPNPGVNPAPKAGDTEVAPTRTKPTTKPGTRPNHPGKNPNPGVNPAPKAGKPSPEQAKEKLMDVIMQILDK
jgi:hypothetical protein